MPRAAGILFVHDGAVLLLKRSASAKDEPRTWGFPGGGIEQGETAEDAARRETQEECDYSYDGPLTPLWTTDNGFQCFGALADDQWLPKLNDEHTAYKWAQFDDLPNKLHPSIAEGVTKMPLIEGKSDKARSENIAIERNAGKPAKQAEAIAYSVQRKAEHAKDSQPEHVQRAYDSLHQLAEDCMGRDYKR